MREGYKRKPSPASLSLATLSRAGSGEFSPLARVSGTGEGLAQAGERVKTTLSLKGEGGEAQPSRVRAFTHTLTPILPCRETGI